MRLSKFNIWVKDYPAPGEYLLFNTRTQALIKVDSQFKSELDKIPHLSDTEISPRIAENTNILKKNGVIVNNEEEEKEKLKEFFHQLKYDSSSLPFEVTILTTYSCNFACTYCFEESVRDNVFLDKETGDIIAGWIIRKVRETRIKRVHLVYYGGEPLLNVRPIYDISWQLKDWAEKNKIEFGFGIITNGSLLNPDLVDKFLTVGLKELRITIDGDRKTHNQKRPFADGNPSFDLIIENIKACIDKVAIGVAGNFDKESFPGVSRLLDFLEEENLLPRLSRIDFSPIGPRLGPKNNPAAIELGECLSFVGKDGLFKEMLAIKSELLNRRVNIRTGLAINACPLFMQDSGVTIDPQGIIYKCNSIVGYPEFAVGDVRSANFNQKNEEFMNIDAWNKCAPDCPYVPMCQGGCRYFSYLENNNFHGLSCKRDYFDRVTPELIKLEYKKLQQEKV